MHARGPAVVGVPGTDRRSCAIVDFADAAPGSGVVSMGFANFTTLFSRHFLVGFMAPPLMALFVLSQLLTSGWLPEGYRTAGPSTKGVIIGAAAVFAALLLSGLQYPVVRLLEGYPFENLPLLSRWYKRRVRRWQAEFDELTEKIADDKPAPARSAAARRLSPDPPIRLVSVA